MIKALVFDLDETLFDHQGGSRNALKRFHKAYCADMEWELVLGRWEKGLRIHFERFVSGEISHQDQRRHRIREIFADGGMDDASADRLFQTYLEAYESCYSVFPDVIPFLVRNNRYKLGVISNGDGNQQRDKIRKTGMEGYFSTVLISGDIDLRKPDSRIFLRACRELGVEPEECVFIGDNYDADYLGSLNAGMRPVLMNRRNGTQRKSVQEIRSLDELKAVLAVMEGKA